LAVALHPGSSGDGDNCLTWSVLASQPEFAAYLDELSTHPENPDEASASEPNQETATASGLAQPEPTSPFPLENHCRSRAAFTSDAEAINFWQRMGPLRLNARTSLPALSRVAYTPQAFDYLVRLPGIGGWEATAYHFASGAFERLDVAQEDIGPELQNLHAAAQRWPKLAIRWLSLQKHEDKESSYFQAITQAVGELEDSTDVELVRDGTPVIPIIMPHDGRGARTARAILRFLRIYGTQVQWNFVLSDIPEETASPEQLATLQSKGANLISVVGPLIRKDLELPVLTERGNQPIFFRLSGSGPNASDSGVYKLVPQLQDQLRAHSLQSQGKLQEPLLVIGPPGKKIEQWRIAADQVLGVDHNPKSMGAMVLTYDPKEPNLATFAEFVRQSAPGTIILATPHNDVDRVLRYLARAGVWAYRKGKKIRPGEVHPIIIGPNSFGLDAKLKQRNRDYLDGVRIASDMPMIEDWQQWPGVSQYIKTEKAYPPIAALRIAAALDRVHERLASEQDVNGNNSAEWIGGKTQMGRLVLEEGALTFPIKVYIFSARQFSPAN